MMDHAEARTMLSARFDGETAGAPHLDEHVASCVECDAFAAALPHVAALARALPPERAAPGLEARIVAAQPPASRPAAWRRRAASVAAVAAVVAALLAGGLGIPTFRVEPAAASHHLVRIESLDLTRTIETTEFDGSATHVVERIRYRAPASVRVDRTTTDATGTRREVEIRVPGKRYTSIGDGRMLRVNVPPEANPVPEPLSPTVALLGTPAGPGPVVAGRPTVRVVLDAGDGVRREALVDAARSTVLDAEVAVVLAKETVTVERTTRKRVTTIRYNAPVDAGVFALPAIVASDGGFRPGPLAALATGPAAIPDGFALVQAGSTIAGDWTLYARGAFTILVRTGPASRSEASEPVLEETATVAGRPARIVVGLYDLPAIELRSRGIGVTIAAPLDRGGLIRLAAMMFPE